MQLAVSLDPWDTPFFGRRIARVEGGDCDAGNMPVLLRWCEDQSIECLYWQVSAGNQAAIRAAEAHSFRLVDVVVGLERVLAAAPREVHPLSGIRAFVEDDMSDLMDIAAHSHRNTRFYHDENFPRPSCERFYRRWIERACRGDSARVWVAECGDKAVGYITCDLPEAGVGEIGLLAVDQRARGQGVGGALLQTALDWFTSQGVMRVRAETHGSDGRSVRFYQRAGFLTRRVGLWYHKWF
jgi:dTDP-4-amino-4,6-dideoxy-D-galactose acyltransferase